MDTQKKALAPFIRDEGTSQGMMLDLCVALAPALIWGIYLFGFRALVITLFSLIFSVGFQALFQAILRRPVTAGDLSAVVSGLLLAMLLPVSVPLWIVPIGAFLVQILGKEVFGGLGRNPINPALFAKAVLLLAFPSYLNRFTQPFAALSPFRIHLSQESLAEEIASSPLSDLKTGDLLSLSVSDRLTGNMPGNIGEVSALLLLAGLLYLLVRRVVTWQTPVFFLGSAALFSFLFPGPGDRFSYVIAYLFTGSLVLGAAFCANDPASSPVTKTGRALYGVLCGAFTVLFRALFDAFQGVVFAILLANLLSRPLDLMCRPRPYGEKNPYLLWLRDRFSRKGAKKGAKSKKGASNR